MKDKFIEKCICWWSKNDLYGRISNIDCSVHSEEVKRRLKDCVEVKDA